MDYLITAIVSAFVPAIVAIHYAEKAISLQDELNELRFCANMMRNALEDGIKMFDRQERAQAEIRALEDKLVRLECQNGLTPRVEP